MSEMRQWHGPSVYLMWNSKISYSSYRTPPGQLQPLATSTRVTDLPSPLGEVNAPLYFQMNQEFPKQLIWTHILCLIWFFRRKYYVRLNNSSHSPLPSLPHSSTLALLLWCPLEESVVVRLPCQASVTTPPPCGHLEGFQTHSWEKQNLEAKEKQSRPIMFLHNVRLCSVIQFGFLG